ncbi:MAG TPA: tetratricopeptide repeat protein [Anaerolineales bacterium]|nr:tetratricopeptide repeat protein [Anaerolineales bacterium]
MPANATFGELLRSLREGQGLTQQALGDRVGCSAITIRKLEGGERRPSVQMAELLAQRLGVPPADRTAFLETARAAPVPPRRQRTLSNLPAETSPLVGRASDLEAVQAGLREPGRQLLTITGPAGVGKTTLALAVGHACLGEFSDGVWFVPLATLADDQLVLSAIGETVGVRRRAHDQASSAAALTALLRKRKLLLILDNFEHVLAAGPSLPPVLAQCPGVRVLVTSRETTHLAMERRHHLAPLTFPGRGEPVGAEASYSAVDLFVACAKSAQPSFTLTSANAAVIGALCSRLDGLPLAIELVAPRVRILSPQQLLDRLTEDSGTLPIDMIANHASGLLGERHNALEDAMAWSYGLLSPTEKKIFRRLGVFTGTWSVESAEAVCQGGVSSPVEVWNALASLIDKSLVHQSEDEHGVRFSLLETVRDYARLELSREGETERVCGQHADHFLALAESASAQWMGAEEETWYRRLEFDLDNLRAALEWMITSGDGLGAARLTVALHRFWQVRGAFLEGHRWLTRVLAMDGSGAGQGPLRIPLEDAAGLMTLELGLPQVSEAHYRNALELSRARGDPLWTARTLSNLGRLAVHQHDPEGAEASLRESLAIFEELGDYKGTLVAQTNLSLVEADLGKFDQSAARMLNCLEGWRSIGWSTGVAVALTYLGAVQCAMGEYQAGNASLEEALDISRGIEAPQREVDVLTQLGIAALHQARFDDAKAHLDRAVMLSQELGTRWGVVEALSARALLEVLLEDESSEAHALAAEAMAREVGDRLAVAVCLHVQARAALQRSDASAAARRIGQSLRQHTDIQDAAGLLLVIETTAELASVRDDPESAARLLGSTHALRLALGIPRPPVFDERLRSMASATEAALGKSGFEAAWTAGGLLATEEAVALAEAIAASVLGSPDPSPAELAR